jgi:uncharacterized protein (DUF1810 family)
MRKRAGKDDYNLQRFVEAQDRVYAQVCSELRAGRKRSHWMWFIFPRLAGLGSSPVARHFAIASAAEAAAYLGHPVLGPRLRECTQLAVDSGNTLDDLFGYPDNLKFRSCITLFAQVSGDEFFRHVLDRFGEPGDSLTLERLQSAQRE